ncbi:transient receptor potential cation channel subfamily V member 6-like [Xenia sp. Carnegie-2017]|uniref:transient receptor potential cation channel subfamily V member 6-like n=1 Tax=Xenia sp. Carnegie-2017 TaxID=2897299 RepID=UPI001F044242|nr:transient receptor potential cation channel subfamily V member 6-like [Xenia sp. Carnegie-2017]
MVEFLINNGADVNIKTNGEGQSPIHFAAKNDACLSLKMLMAYDADMGARDYQDRTPLQVAAEMSRSKAAKLLIDMGAPAGVYDMKGEVALSLLILKMPDVALIALDQFHSEDMINRKEYYFLNYLEGQRLSEEANSGARTPLEVAIQRQQFDIVMHPVMQRLVYMKWKKFGKRGAWLDLATNLLFSILWTILGVTLPNNANELYEPISKRWWRLLLAILVMLLTFLEIFKQMASIYRVKKDLSSWKSYREKELERDLPFCHPRWPDEKKYLDGEIKAVREERLLSSQDGWFYIDWFALVLIMASAITHATFFFLNTSQVYDIHIRSICLLLIVIWFRIMKYARPFKGPGPFVALFSHMLVDILKWVFLFLVFFIPYSACFWMIFGAYSKNPVDDYDTLPELLYSVFGMTVLDNYEFKELEKRDAVMARVLCGTYISICSIIILNLLIALLADTFTRVYENAIENAAMQRAKTILNLEQSLRKSHQKRYYDFIREHCSPEVKDYDAQDDAGNERHKKRHMEEMRLQVNDIYQLINERFGKRFGESQKSDLDELIDKMTNVTKETAKIRTSVQLTMLRLKALEQGVKTLQDTAPVANGTITKLIADVRRPSHMSLPAFVPEKKSKSGKTSKKRFMSEPDIQKKRERSFTDEKYATLVQQKRPSSRGSGRSVDINNRRQRDSAIHQSRDNMDEDVIVRERKEMMRKREDQARDHQLMTSEHRDEYDTVSGTDDAIERAQPTTSHMVHVTSSEDENAINEKSSLMEMDDKKTQEKKGKLSKQSSTSTMPKPLADVYKKAKQQGRFSSDSSHLEEEMISRGLTSSMPAPMSTPGDLSDTSYITTDN